MDARVLVLSELLQLTMRRMRFDHEVDKLCHNIQISLTY